MKLITSVIRLITYDAFSGRFDKMDGLVVKTKQKSPETGRIGAF